LTVRSRLPISAPFASGLISTCIAIKPLTGEPFQFPTKSGTLSSLFIAAFVPLLEAAPLAPQRTDAEFPFRCSEESRKRLKVEAVRIGDEIKPPKKLVDATPQFPELPPGTKVILRPWVGEALVGTDGAVVHAWAIRELTLNPPFPEFNEAILKAIRKWKYEPIRVKGQRTPFCTTITVNINGS